MRPGTPVRLNEKGVRYLDGLHPQHEVGDVGMVLGGASDPSADVGGPYIEVRFVRTGAAEVMAGDEIDRMEVADDK